MPIRNVSLSGKNRRRKKPRTDQNCNLKSYIFFHRDDDGESSSTEKKNIPIISSEEHNITMIKTLYLRRQSGKPINAPM